MNYIVVEAQTNANGTTALLTSVHSTQNEAESKYHLVLSAAAASDLPRHSAALLDETGYSLKSWCYEHGENNGSA